MNKLVFEGIVLGIEEKEYGGGKKFAVMQMRNDNDIVEVACFGQNYKTQAALKNGDHVRITGKLTSRDYVDKNGKPRTTLQVKLDEIGIKILDNKKAEPHKESGDSTFDDLPF